jgi:enoyl-CoA hydratase/carnithine racemase
VRIERTGAADQIVFTSPILAIPVLDAMASALRSLAAAVDPRPLVLRSDHPTVFLAGADLREIAALDPTKCVEYARRGRAVVGLLERHPAPTVAAVDGSCSGGGFDIAMACDAVVASRRATFEHPGARRGLVTGWSGTVSAPAVFGNATARALLVEGRRLDTETALSLGLIGRESAEPVRDAVNVALEIALLHPSRRHLWRLLKGGSFVDRFRASVIHKL